MSSKGLIKYPLAIMGFGLLIFIVCQIVPWEMVLVAFSALFLIAFVALLLLGAVRHVKWQIEQGQQGAAIPLYQPPKSQWPGLPPQVNSSLGLGLTAAEYNEPSKLYQQGYQAQAPRWVQPRYDSQLDYEEPYAEYPEQLPPTVMP